MVYSLADLVCYWRYNLIFDDELSTILLEAHKELNIEFMEEQARLAADYLSQAPLILINRIYLLIDLYT